MARIEEKNAQLLQLKASTSRSVQHLNGLKKTLKELLDEQAQLRKDIRTRTELLKRLRQENSAVSSQVDVERRAGERLDAAVEEGADLPRVLDYVRSKAGHFEAEHTKRSWARKLEIAEMAAKQAESRLRQAKRAAIAARNGPLIASAGSGSLGSSSIGAGGATTRLIREDPAAALDAIAQQLEAAAGATKRGRSRAGDASRAATGIMASQMSTTSSSSLGGASTRRRRGVAGAPVRTIHGARSMGGPG